jgi:tetratricopeptide (TPR) repeat protein
MTKMHLANISKPGFDSILGTFMEAFPHVTVWFPTTKPYVFFYLIGSADPQVYRPAAIDAKLARPAIRDSVDVLNFTNSHDVLSCYIADENDLKRYLTGYRTNSDMTPFVEFNLSPEDLVGSPFFADFVETVRTRSVYSHLDFTGMSDEEKERWLRDHEVVYDTATEIFKTHRRQDIVARLVHVARGMKRMPKHPALLDQRQRTLILANRMLEKGEYEALLRQIEKALQEEPDSALGLYLKAVILEKAGQYEAAHAAAARGVEVEPDNATLRNQLGVLSHRLRDTEGALAQFAEAVRLDPNNASYHRNLGGACLASGDKERAAEEFRKALALNPADQLARAGLRQATAAGSVP